MARRFRIGDRVRVISIADAVKNMPPKLRDGKWGTLTVLQRLLDERRICPVVEITPETGWPWISCEFRPKGARREYHELVVEPECLELVEKAGKARRPRR